MKHTYLYLILLFAVSISTILLTRKLIPWLSKKAKQPIYGEGPSWHMKKSGTPTMGGIGFIVPSVAFMTILAIYLIVENKSEVGLSLLISAVFCLLNSLVGIWDDLTKIKRSENAGLTPAQKLLLQGVLAASFLTIHATFFGKNTRIFFGSVSIDAGIAYYPLAILFILGIINCANLTDGVDGLAGSVSFAIAVSVFLLSLGKNTDTLILSSVGIGASLGFLFFNIHPAKIFMGDTGSLFFGALCVSYAFSLNSLPAFILIGGVYVIEGISVILQVLFFKATGKRVFKMAPIHHHLEKCGFDESKICVYAILATFVLSVIASGMIGGGI